MLQENHNLLFIERFKMRVIEIIEQIKNSNDNFFVLIDTAKNHLYYRRWLKKLAKDQLIQR